MAKSKTNSKPGPHTLKASVRMKDLVFAVAMLIALYVIIPQLDQFANAFQAVRHANTWLIAAAEIAIVCAVLASAAVYVFLAFKPIKYDRSAIIQTAGMFINRLLPAGIGGMSLSADFLYRNKHSLPQASTIVIVNNTITFIGHITLLVVTVVAADAAFPAMTSLHIPLQYYVYGGLIAAVLIIIFRNRFAGAIRRFAKELVGSLALYARRKRRLLTAMLFALMNTLGHASAIALCMHAFGLDLPLVAALVVLTGGVAAASVTPTPGGLLGSEAGLTAVLIGYGVEGGTALAVALSYRLVSYWLPLLPGALAFWYAQQKRYI
jgi:glycosyltransferase 2 family protein